MHTIGKNVSVMDAPLLPI